VIFSVLLRGPLYINSYVFVYLISEDTEVITLAGLYVT